MTTPRPRPNDAVLREVLARRAAGPNSGAELVGEVLAAVEALPQRQAWSWGLAPELSFVPVLLAVAFLLTALIGVALFAGGGGTLPRGDSSTTYASGGDIHVGDPATGDTVAIVTGPEIDSGPIFSPDGALIAFTRGDTFANNTCKPAIAPCQTSILVVRPDGSDERVIVPAPFLETGLGGFSWTPDSASLLVNHDERGGPLGGYLTLFDVSGVVEPRLLTPPLPRWPGAYHPQIGGEIAPMFRPPSGDRILSYPGPEDPGAGSSALVEMDIDGSDVRVLIDPAQTDLPFRVIEGPVWSPDAESIALVARNEACPRWACDPWQPLRIFVISADGSQIRPLTRGPAEVAPGGGVFESAPAWSPDGSRILMTRTTVENLDAAPEQRLVPIRVQIVAVEVATGAERELTAPYDIMVRQEPYPHTEAVSPIPTASWSPDGRSVLLFEGPGTRPIVIDLETGASTELPWASDSHPSWRQTATGHPD